MLDIDNDDNRPTLTHAGFVYHFDSFHNVCVFDEEHTLHTHAQRRHYSEDFVEDREFFTWRGGRSKAEARYEAERSIDALNDYLATPKGKKFMGRMILEECKAARLSLRNQIIEAQRAMGEIKVEEERARKFFGVTGD